MLITIGIIVMLVVAIAGYCALILSARCSEREWMPELESEDD